MKTNKLYIATVIIVILTVCVAAFHILDDLTNQSVNSVNGYTILSSFFLAIRAIGIWQKIAQVFWTVIAILAIVFFICGMGICFGL